MVTPLVKINYKMINEQQPVSTTFIELKEDLEVQSHLTQGRDRVLLDLGTRSLFLRDEEFV